VQIGAGAARGVLELGEGFFFHGHDGDVMPEAAGALQDEEGEPAVAGDQTDAGHLRSNNVSKLASI